MKKISYLAILISCFLGAQAYAVERLPGENIMLKSSQGMVSLQELQGKVVYLNFWASWCGPCRKSFSWMVAMQRKYVNKGLVVLAVNLDTDPAQALRFLEENQSNFQIAYDPEGYLANNIKLKAMPSSFLLNSKGEILHRHLGFQSAQSEDYESEIRHALGLKRIAKEELLK